MIWQFVRFRRPQVSQGCRTQQRDENRRNKPCTQKSKGTTQRYEKKKGETDLHVLFQLFPQYCSSFLCLLPAHVLRVDKYNTVKSLRWIFCCLPDFFWMLGTLGFIISGVYQEVPGYCEKFWKVIKIQETICPLVGSIPAHLRKAQITDEAKIKKGSSKADATLWNGDVQTVPGSCELQLGTALEIPETYWNLVETVKSVSWKVIEESDWPTWVCTQSRTAKALFTIP